MFNPDQAQAYIAMAERLGLRVVDSDEVKKFIHLLRFLSAKITNPAFRNNASDAEICRQEGISYNLIETHKGSRIWQVCTQIMLAEYLTDASRADIRREMFKAMTELFPKALDNILRTASGQLLDKNGNLDPKQANNRDQVAAFVALSQSPITQVWLDNAFLGPESAREEDDHLAIIEGLRKTQLLQLDQAEVLDAEVISSAPSTSAPSVDTVAPSDLAGQPVDTPVLQEMSVPVSHPS